MILSIDNKIKTYVFPFLLFLTLALISVRVLFSHPGVISFNDWTIPPFNGQVSSFYKSLFYVWHDSYGVNTINSNLSIFPYLFFAISALLGLNGSILTSVIVILCLVLSGFVIYALSLSLGRNFWPSLIAGIFYMFTPWIFVRITNGDIANMFNYFIMPLVFWFYIKSRSKDGKIALKYLVAIPLLLSFADARAMIITFTLILLYAVYDTLTSKEKRTRLVTNIKSMIIVTGLTVAIYFFYFFPLIASTGGLNSGIPGTLDDLLTRSLMASWPNVVRLSGNSSGFFLAAQSSNAWWPITSYLVVFLILLAPFVAWRKKGIIFFSIIGLISLFLSMGSNSLTGPIYEWGFLNISFLQAFRDPDKFTILACFAYAILLGATVQFLSDKFRSLSLHISSSKLKKLKSNYLPKFLVVVFVCSLILLDAQPFLTGDFAGFLHTTNYPAGYRETYNWLSAQSREFKTLWLPPGYLISYDFANYPQHDLMAFGSPEPNAFGWFASPDYSSTGRFEQFLFSLIYQGGPSSKFIGEALTLADVKYVIFPMDADSWEFYYWDGPSQGNRPVVPHELRDQAFAAISSQQNLQLVKTFGSIHIFENLDFKSGVYADNSSAIVAGGFSSLLTLSYLNDFNYDNTAVFFANQINNIVNSEILNKSSNIMIQQDNFLDFVFSFLPTQYIITPSDFTTRTDLQHYWSKLFYYWWGRDWRYLDPTTECAITSSNPDLDIISNVLFTNQSTYPQQSTLDIPFSVSEGAQYDIWAQLFFGPNGGLLNFQLDGANISEVNTKATSYLGYRWVNLGSEGNLSGKHSLTITNKGGEQVVSQVIVAPTEIIQQAYSAASQAIGKKNLTLLLEPEEMQLSDFGSSNVISGSKIPSVIDSLQPTGLSSSSAAVVSSQDQVDQGTFLQMAKTFTFEAEDFPNQASGTNTFSDLSASGGAYIGRSFANGESSYVASTDNLGLSNGQYDVLVRAWCNTTGTTISFSDTQNADTNWQVINQEKVSTANQWEVYNLGSVTNPTGLDVFVKNVNQDSNVKIDYVGLVSEQSPSISQEVYIPESSCYQFNVRVNGSYHAVLSVDNTNLNMNENLTNFTWVKAGSIYLQKGEHNLTMTVQTGGLEWNILEITSADESKLNQTNLVDLTFAKINPTSYSVQVEGGRPAFLILADPYNPSWQASVNGGTFESLPAFSFLNSFVVDSGKNQTISIGFASQNIYSVGLALSYLTFISISLYLVSNQIKCGLKWIARLMKRLLHFPN